MNNTPEPEATICVTKHASSQTPKPSPHPAKSNPIGSNPAGNSPADSSPTNNSPTSSSPTSSSPTNSSPTNSSPVGNTHGSKTVTPPGNKTSSARPNSTKPKTKHKRRRRSNGWIPDQHGAWAMIALPFLYGATRGGWTWYHLSLGLTWIIGYLAFFAGSTYLVSRGKKRYLPALLSYGTLTIISGIVTLGLHWQLAIWALPFLPLIGVSIWAAYKRKTRSMANNLSTITATTIVGAVAYSLSQNGLDHHTNWPVITVNIFLLWGYFLATVLYVKTNIRERGHLSWLQASIGTHLGFAILTTILAYYRLYEVTGLLAFLWWLLIIRAVAIGGYSYVGSQKGKARVPVAVLAISEIIAVGLLILILTTASV